MAWSRVAPTVKALDSTEPLSIARPDAVRVFRRYFRGQPTTTADAQRVAAEIIVALGGYYHHKLYVEIYNELGRDEIRASLDFFRTVTHILQIVGYKVALPCWATGNFEAEDWDLLRSLNWLGADCIALHAYWNRNGLTEWNALRYRKYWRLNDPPILITECGRDRVRDGDFGSYIGAEGWKLDGVSREAYLAEARAFDCEISKDSYVIGAHWFTIGEDDRWRFYGLDDMAVGEFAGPGPVIPARRGIVTGYPDAAWRPSANYGYPITGARGRLGHEIVFLVDHIAQGYESGVSSWFATSGGVSAHYLVCRDGRIIQYVDEKDAAYGCGITNRPDLANPFIADAMRNAVNMNLLGINIEHEGYSGVSMPEAQFQATLRLHADICKRYSLPINKDRIFGHNKLDSVSRANDPGTAFPWDRLFAGLLPQPVNAVDDALNGIAHFGTQARAAGKSGDIAAMNRHLDSLWVEVVQLKQSIGK